MVDYLHHVDGRLRIRARPLRTESAVRRRILRALREQAGVEDVRLNARAGSVTVFYDSAAIEPEALLRTVREAQPETPVQPPRLDVPRSSAPRPGGARGPADARRFAAALITAPLTAEVARMALGVVVNKGVSYSLGRLLGARGL